MGFRETTELGVRGRLYAGGKPHIFCGGSRPKLVCQGTCVSPGNLPAGRKGSSEGASSSANAKRGGASSEGTRGGKQESYRGVRKVVGTKEGTMPDRDEMKGDKQET